MLEAVLLFVLGASGVTGGVAAFVRKHGLVPRANLEMSEQGRRDAMEFARHVTDEMHEKVDLTRDVAGVGATVGEVLALLSAHVQSEQQIGRMQELLKVHESVDGLREELAGRQLSDEELAMFRTLLQELAEESTHGRHRQAGAVPGPQLFAVADLDADLDEEESA